MQRLQVANSKSVPEFYNLVKLHGERYQAEMILR